MPGRASHFDLLSGEVNCPHGGHKIRATQLRWFMERKNGDPCPVCGKPVDYPELRRHGDLSIQIHQASTLDKMPRT